MSRAIFFALLGALLFLGLSAAFVVTETERVIVLQFGRPVKSIEEAGLYFKLPFFQNIVSFDKRILEWDGEPNQIPTKDKKFISVDVTARWRVVDQLQFYKSVRDELGAQKKLDDIIDGITRDIISDELLIEIVRNTNRELTYYQEFSTQQEEERRIRKEKIEIGTGRDNITKRILKGAQRDVKNLGIDVIDVMIQRVNYTDSVRQTVFARMISERKKVAERYRAQGKGERARILGRMQKEIKAIRSESYRKAEEIKGKADAEATRIYAETYNQDPQFFAFIKSLQNYRSNIDDKTTLLFTTDNQFLKFLKSSE